MRASFPRPVAVLLAVALVAGCGGDRTGRDRDDAPGAPGTPGAGDPASRDLPPDTSRAGHAFLAVYRDGPVSELRVVRATDGGIVVAGSADFPSGTKVAVTLLDRAKDGTLEAVASTRATVDLGHFMGTPLAPASGPPPPGIHVLRITAAFGPTDQDPEVLRAAADGRRYHGTGVRTLPGGRVVYDTTLEVPL